MKRSLLQICLATAIVADGSASAQTAAVNPQRPTRTVNSVESGIRIKTEAARLDALLEHALRRHRQELNPVVDDATFVRRAYLSIIGRIPSLKETEAFLDDPAEDKRHKLCDNLLDSPGRTSHFANWWFDILRVRSRNSRLSGEPFAHWIRESVQEDKPYDEFVHEMLTAKGPAHQPGNGATGHLLRDINMPHDSMANTVRIFLGTRLECAQCHNHPTDTWTQMDFYGMAAFFGGLRYRDDEALMRLRGAREKLRNADDRTRNNARRLTQSLTYGLTGSGTGAERLPKDYAYDDARPREAVTANTIFGANIRLKKTTSSERRRKTRAARKAGKPVDTGIDSRTAMAEWLVSKKNPMFTKMIVNRMWNRTFGRGLVEPIDDWKKDNQPVHPEILKHCEKLLVALDYDLRQFERVLLRTELFQREAPRQDPPADKPYAFPGPVMRRLTAEQMWDSLLTLVFDDLDERLRPMDSRAQPVYAAYDQMKDSSIDDIIAMAEQRMNPNSMMRRSMQRQEREQRQQRVNDTARQKRARPLLRQLAMARRDGDQERVQEIATRLEAMGVGLGRRASRGNEGSMIRASDLQQPAPAGHLLRQFGQSDRETIEASNDDATVPQVLTLLNGFLDQRVIAGRSALSRDLTTAENGRRRVEIAFLTTLNRKPSEAETRQWRRAIAIDGEQAIKDLVWVLCNSNEFRFLR